MFKVPISGTYRFTFSATSTEDPNLVSGQWHPRLEVVVRVVYNGFYENLRAGLADLYLGWKYT